MKFNSGTLFLALCLGGSLFAQTAPPAQTAPKLPSGISALPAVTERDSVKPDDMVITVGTQKITREQFEKIKQNLPAQLAASAQATGERGFAAQWAQLHSFVMLAERDKLQDTADFKAQLDFARDQILAQMAVQRLLAGTQVISDAEVKAYYDSHIVEMQQGNLRGILVAFNPAPKAGAKPGDPPISRSDEQAKARVVELRNKILAGGDFAAVAKEDSDHQNSAEKGGDFGLIRKGQLASNLDAAIFALKPKELSEPIKESVGYYIFRFDDVKTVSLDEATATIRQKLQQEKTQAAVKSVNDMFPVTFNDKYFGAPPAPAGTAAPAAAQAPAAGAKPVVTGVAPAKPAAQTTPPSLPAGKKK